MRFQGPGASGKTVLTVNGLFSLYPKLLNCLIIDKIYYSDFS